MRHLKNRNILHTAALAALFGGAILTGVYRGQETSAERATSTAASSAIPGSTLASAVAEAVVPAAAWDIPNLDHYRVDYFVRRFTTAKRADLEIYMARSGRYQELISRKLAERNMPQDLLYLAMIESGFNPKAYSHAHASGIWQFIPDTARRYGLVINRAVDERNDPEKATDAALSYLSDLHDRFGSWYLAAAAYNTGENRVGRIMRQVTGSEKGTDDDYYRIWNRLPRETRDYVPLMVAAARIAKDPVAYGFGHVQPLAPFDYVEKTFAPATPLATVARSAGTTVAVIRQLNPELRIDRTRNDMPSVLRIPSGAA